MSHDKTQGKKLSVSELALNLAQPFAEELGLKFWNVKYEKEGSAWFLRYFMFIEERPITIDDCEAFSRKVSDELDRTDPIDGSYYLEVSSPGLEAELEETWHFERNIGNKVQIKLVRPFENKREFIGPLVKFEDKIITVSDEISGNEYEFELSKTAYVKLYAEF